MSRNRRPIEKIAPDDFTDAYPGETIEECLNYAHSQATTSTPAEELPRCPDPECQSRRIKHKTEKHDGQGAKDGAYVCSHCRNHFDDPVYLDPEEEEETAEETAEETDPFEWVTEDDLADPPLPRRLAELDDRRLAALVIYLYRPWSPTGPSYRDLGPILPYSPTWVGDRVRAWKDGEYRDLVRDPRPRVSLAIDAEEVSAE